MYTLSCSSTLESQKNLEEALQTLIAKQPNIINGRQIEPGSADPPRFVLLRREMPIGDWSLDHLLVDQRGGPTFVEAKLIENPEARRAVIGQVLDYVALASERWGDGQRSCRRRFERRLEVLRVQPVCAPITC